MMENSDLYSLDPVHTGTVTLFIKIEPRVHQVHDFYITHCYSGNPGHFEQRHEEQKSKPVIWNLVSACHA